MTTTKSEQLRMHFHCALADVPGSGVGEMHVVDGTRDECTACKARALREQNQTSGTAADGQAK